MAPNYTLTTPSVSGSGSVSVVLEYIVTLGNWSETNFLASPFTSIGRC